LESKRKIYVKPADIPAGAESASRHIAAGRCGLRRAHFSQRAREMGHPVRWSFRQDQTWVTAEFGWDFVGATPRLWAPSCPPLRPRSGQALRKSRRWGSQLGAGFPQDQTGASVLSSPPKAGRGKTI
jgi:hypothetical protein